MLQYSKGTVGIKNKSQVIKPEKLLQRVEAKCFELKRLFFFQNFYANQTFATKPKKQYSSPPTPAPPKIKLFSLKMETLYTR